jgi:hypothetical protein
MYEKRSIISLPSAHQSVATRHSVTAHRKTTGSLRVRVSQLIHPRISVRCLQRFFSIDDSRPMRASRPTRPQSTAPRRLVIILLLSQPISLALHGLHQERPPLGIRPDWPEKRSNSAKLVALGPLAFLRPSK